MSNPIRFSGLASGLDTESMVKALAQPYQNKVDQAKQDKVLLEWRKDAYKQINSKIVAFKDKYIAKMKLNSTFNKTQVAVSNTNVIGIDPNVTIPAGTHTIKVESMAQGALVPTTSKDAGTTKDTIISNTDTDFEMVVDTGNGPKTVAVKVTAGMKISEFEAKVQEELKNQGVADGVNFKFDESSRAFIVSSTATGEKQEISVTKGNDLIGQSGVPIKGKDAKITYNGGITVNSNTNKIEVNGIKFDIKGMSNENITISSTKDTGATTEFIKGFVEEYNKLTEEINTLVGADSAKDFKPLTEEQKKGMTDKEIELWEKKLKDSLLRNDSVLKDVTGMMRGVLGGEYSDINDSYNTFSEIGITTGNWKERGKLHINEEKLKKALNENGDDVVKLMNKMGEELDKQFSTRLATNELKSYNSLFNDKLIDKSITSKKDEITKAEAKYAKMENMYYKQFTAMEKMMNSLNSQSSWLSQAGGM